MLAQFHFLDLPADLHLFLNQVLGLHKAIDKAVLLLLKLLQLLVLLLHLHLPQALLLQLYLSLFLNQLAPEMPLLSVQREEHLEVLAELRALLTLDDLGYLSRLAHFVSL